MDHLLLNNHFPKPGEPEREGAIEIALLLGERIRSYTGGNSSLKDVTAADILSSIEFCLKAGRNRKPGTEVCRRASAGRNLREDFTVGLERVKKCYADTKKLYVKIATRKLPVPLDAYQDTLDHAMPDFFNSYDPDYFAQEIPCAIDYPLAFDDMSLQGIFYIRRYLETLELETEFCRCYPMEQVLDFLNGFQKKHGWEAMDAPLNLLGVLFEQQILSLLCGKECPDLWIEPFQIKVLNRDLSEKAPEDIHRMIARATAAMIRSLGLRNPGLEEYLKKYSAQLSCRLLEAAKHGDLSPMAVFLPRRPDPLPGGTE